MKISKEFLEWIIKCVYHDLLLQDKLTRMIREDTREAEEYIRNLLRIEWSPEYYKCHSRSEIVDLGNFPIQIMDRIRERFHEQDELDILAA